MKTLAHPSTRIDGKVTLVLTLEPAIVNSTMFTVSTERVSQEVS